jgi:5-formyltetrahydrofolate cyclo-ligase
MPTARAVPSPRSAHGCSEAASETRKRGRRVAIADPFDVTMRLCRGGLPEVDKRALRAELRSTRAAFPARSLPVQPAFLARLTPGQAIATYTPIRGEPDPAPFAVAALAAGCTLTLPHVVDRATPLRFLAWSGEDLTPGPFGLANPHPHWAEVVPDIVLTPLVGFDRQGNRVGQGAGHYDRAFSACPNAWRVGLAWSVQDVAVLEPDPWDIPLHAIATEKEWIVPMRNRP